MNTRKLVLLFTALLGLTASAFAETQTTQATVARVTGAATVTLPDGSTAPLTAGMKIAQGSTITTGADGDVYVESHAGYVTSIKKNSTVLVEEISVSMEDGKLTKENTTMDLKSGNLIALLDPKKKAVNNYQVRTAKGVAAARGTAFSVVIKGQRTNVYVANGTVSFAVPAYGTISIGAGKFGSSGIGLSMPFSGWNIGQDQENSDAGEAKYVTGIIAAMAVATENGIGGANAAEFRTVLDSVIKNAPGLAPEIAALVQKFAPSQSQAVKESTATNAPQQIENVKNAIANPSSTESTSGRGTAVTTTPQTIDPSTVSRSK